MFIVLAVLVASVLSEAPQSASNLFRPSGRLLLLPARLENPPPTETNNTQVPQQDAEEKKKVMSEQLLDSGEYYVLLPDGRLQMVQYSTAALKEETPAPAPQQVKAAEPVPAPFAQFQVEYLQYPMSQQLSQPLPQDSQPVPQDSQDSEDSQEQVSGFQANLQYREVKPISAPIYAYNPAPLVRVLRR